MTETDDAFLSTDDGGEEAVVDETASVDEEEAANPTALIPTSALGGSPKVGDTVTLKVVALHDQEAEVSIKSGKSKDKEETKTADVELDAISSSYQE